MKVSKQISNGNANRVILTDVKCTSKTFQKLDSHWWCTWN